MKRLRTMLIMLFCIAAVMMMSTVIAGAEESEEQKEKSVARVGEKYYDSLSEAFKAVAENGNNGTVELVADAEIESVINISAGKSITLNLHGYKVTPAENCASGKAFCNRGTFTIMGEDSGAIDVTSKADDWIAIENRDRGELNIISGKVIGNGWGIRVFSGSINISGGEVSSTKTYTKESCAVQLIEGTEAIVSGNGSIKSDVAPAIRASGAKITISENAEIQGTFGIILLNGTEDNTKGAVHSSLTMTGGTVEAAEGFALSGNNLSSAQCSAEITGGTLKNTARETCIYWPMEGELTIGGDAVVKGATGIEIKMGTLNVKDNAQIKGYGEWSENEPMGGGSQADGSAILVSSQMYGDASGQYIDTSDITVNIAGGNMSSEKGNAVTVYNTEKTEGQNAEVVVTGGMLDAAKGKTALKVIMPEKGNKSELKQENGITTFETSKSNTRVTVSSEAALAVVDRDGETYYYTDVNDALKANSAESTEVHIYVIGSSEVNGDALESKNVKLTAAEGVSLKITSAVEDMIVKETTNSDGSKTYELVEKSEGNTENPKVEINADKKEVHAGEQITLTADVTNKDANTEYSYEWYKNNNIINGQSQSSLTVTETGTYKVKVTAYKKTDNTALISEGESEAVICTVNAHEYTGEWKYDNENHWQLCQCGEKGNISAHKFGEWNVTKEPSASEEGSRVKVCSVCGYKFTETIPANSGSTSGNASDNTPKSDVSANTGDDSNIALWAAVMMLAAAGGTSTVLYGRRKKHID